MMTDRVRNIIKYIELLTVPSGKGAGAPFKLAQFEIDFINKIYGPVDKKGRRIVRRAIESIARKNGKTALTACLVLVHLDGPEEIMNGEIYSAANERDQAAIVFKYVRQMIELEPELQENLRVVESTKTIISERSGSVYRAISADAGSKHGFNPTVVIYDELAQAKKRDLFDALDTSFGAREEPLLIIISTQSSDPQHILSELIDDALSGKDPSIVIEHHAVPDDCEDIFDESIWHLANPALGKFRDLEDFRILAKRAKRMPSFETAFRNLYLNQRIDAKNPLISRVEWMACKNDDCRIKPGEKIYLGLDLSATTDLCALVAVTANKKYDKIAAWFWKPGDTISEHETRDRVFYRAWEQQGFIIATEGRSVDYKSIALKMSEISQDYNIVGVAYDRWRIENLLKDFDYCGVDAWVDEKDSKLSGGIRLIPWGQGYKDMAPAVDALEASVIDRKMVHNGNPVLTWNISNAMVITDPAGNRKLDKSKSRFRIDGAIALAMALGLKNREKEEPQFEMKLSLAV